MLTSTKPSLNVIQKQQKFDEECCSTKNLKNITDKTIISKTENNYQLSLCKNLKVNRKRLIKSGNNDTKNSKSLKKICADDNSINDEIIQVPSTSTIQSSSIQKVEISPLTLCYNSVRFFNNFK